MNDQPTALTVSFLEPALAGCVLLGSWPMLSAPAKGEIVVLPLAAKAKRGKFRVHEVLHHLPERCLPPLTASVTVLVVPIVDGSDIDRAVSELCLQSDPASWPRPRLHPA